MSPPLDPSPAPSPAPLHDAAVAVGAPANNASCSALDIAFLLDCTGSMSAYIRMAQKSIQNVVLTVLEDPRVESCRFAMIAYRDYTDKDLIEVKDFTPRPQDFTDFVGRLQATGGGDYPEAVSAALLKVPDLSWDQNAAHVVVLIADAPPHGTPGMHHGADSYPAGSASGAHGEHYAAIVRRLAATQSGLRMFAVNVSATAGKEMKIAFTEMARVLGGAYVQESNTDSLSKFIANLAAEGPGNSHLHATVCRTFLATVGQLKTSADSSPTHQACPPPLHSTIEGRNPWQVLNGVGRALNDETRQRLKSGSPEEIARILLGHSHTELLPYRDVLLIVAESAPCCWTPVAKTVVGGGEADAQQQQKVPTLNIKNASANIRAVVGGGSTSVSSVAYKIEVQQSIENANDTNLEIKLRLPVPSGWVVDGIRFQVGTQTAVETRIERNAAAGQKYDDAMAEGRVAVLAEFNTDGSLSLNVGALGGFEVVQLVARYSVMGRVEADWGFVLPAVIWPAGDVRRALVNEFNVVVNVGVEGDAPHGLRIEGADEQTRALLDGAPHSVTQWPTQLYLAVQGHASLEGRHARKAVEVEAFKLGNATTLVRVTASPRVHRSTDDGAAPAQHDIVVVVDPIGCGMDSVFVRVQRLLHTHHQHHHAGLVSGGLTLLLPSRVGGEGDGAAATATTAAGFAMHAGESLVGLPAAALRQMLRDAEGAGEGKSVKDLWEKTPFEVLEKIHGKSSSNIGVFVVCPERFHTHFEFMEEAFPALAQHAWFVVANGAGTPACASNVGRAALTRLVKRGSTSGGIFGPFEEENLLTFIAGMAEVNAAWHVELVVGMGQTTPNVILPQRDGLEQQTELIGGGVVLSWACSQVGIIERWVLVEGDPADVTASVRVEEERPRGQLIGRAGQVNTQRGQGKLAEERLDLNVRAVEDLPCAPGKIFENDDPRVRYGLSRVCDSAEFAVKWGLLSKWTSFIGVGAQSHTSAANAATQAHVNADHAGASAEMDVDVDDASKERILSGVGFRRSPEAESRHGRTKRRGGGRGGSSLVYAAIMERGDVRDRDRSRSRSRERAEAPESDESGSSFDECILEGISSPTPRKRKGAAEEEAKVMAGVLQLKRVRGGKSGVEITADAITREAMPRPSSAESPCVTGDQMRALRSLLRRRSLGGHPWTANAAVLALLEILAPERLSRGATPTPAQIVDIVVSFVEAHAGATLPILAEVGMTLDQLKNLRECAA